MDGDRRRRRSRSREDSRSRSRERRSDGHRRRRHRSRSSSGSPARVRDQFTPSIPTAVSAGLSAYGVPAPGMPTPGMPMPGMAGLYGQAAMGINPMIANMLQQAVTPGAFTPVPDKTQLELFVGNTPPNTSEFVLLNFLNAAMAQVNLNTAPGNPIVQCRVSNKFAFIELRSVDETNNCLSLNQIPFMGTPLKIGRPSKYRGPPVNCTTWQALTGQPELAGGTMMPGAGGSMSGLDPATKVYRELYVGNVQPTMTEASIAEFLGTTLQKVGLATSAPGNPVVIARSSGNFSFIEMRSIEDANAMLNLNGIPFMGSTLRISRPAKYAGPMTPAMTWPDVLARLVAQGGGADKALGTPAAPTQPATRVLRLNNMLSADDLADEEGLADIEEETKGECATFGPVKKVHIVRPSTTDAAAEKTATGVGYVFVEFEEADAARKAMLSLSTRTFDNKKVEVTFWPEEKFAQGDYGDGP